MLSSEQKSFTKTAKSWNQQRKNVSDDPNSYLSASESRVRVQTERRWYKKRRKMNRRRSYTGCDTVYGINHEREELSYTIPYILLYCRLIKHETGSPDPNASAKCVYNVLSLSEPPRNYEQLENMDISVEGLGTEKERLWKPLKPFLTNSPTVECIC